MAVTPVTQSAVVDPIATSTTSANLSLRPVTHGRIIANNSAGILYIFFGTTAASSTNFTVAIAANSFYELNQPPYGGQITGVLSTGTGTALVTTW